jgi:hypothetical protein
MADLNPPPPYQPPQAAVVREQVAAAPPHQFIYKVVIYRTFHHQKNSIPPDVRNMTWEGTRVTRWNPCDDSKFREVVHGFFSTPERAQVKLEAVRNTLNEGDYITIETEALI